MVGLQPDAVEHIRAGRLSAHDVPFLTFRTYLAFPQPQVVLRHKKDALWVSQEVFETARRMRSSTFIKVRKLKDGQNRYLVQPDPTQDALLRR